MKKKKNNEPYIYKNDLGNNMYTHILKIVGNTWAQDSA